MATEETAPTSNFLLDKLKFGELNPVGSTRTRTMPDMHTPDSAMETLRAAAAQSFKIDAFSGTSAFKGVVLRIDETGTPGTNTQSTFGDWFNNYTSIFAAGAGSPTQNRNLWQRVLVFWHHPKPAPWCGLIMGIGKRLRIPFTFRR